MQLTSDGGDIVMKSFIQGNIKIRAQNHTVSMFVNIKLLKKGINFLKICLPCESNSTYIDRDPQNGYSTQ